MVIFRNNLKRFIGSKPKLIIVFIVPMLFTILFMSDDNNIQVSIAVADEDLSVISRELIGKLQEESEVKIIMRNEIRDNIIVGDVDYALIIPKGFQEGIINSHPISIEELYFIDSMKLHGARSFIQNYVRNLKFIGKNVANEEEFFQKTAEFEQENYVFDKVIRQGHKANESEGAIGYMIQFILYMSIITSALLIIDRDRNTVVRIIASSLPRSHYIVQSFLSFITIGVIQVSIMFVFYHFYFALYFGKNFIILFLLMSTFVIVANALSMIIVILTKNEKFSYGLILVLTTPLVMLGGGYFNLEAMPQAVQLISKFIPTYWTMEGARMLINDNHIKDVAVNFLVLLTFTATFLIISMIGYKKFAKE